MNINKSNKKNLNIWLNIEVESSNYILNNNKLKTNKSVGLIEISIFRKIKIIEDEIKSCLKNKK